MSVTAAAGFEAAGVSAGLRSSEGPDVALVVNRGPLQHAAAVFTSNRAKANPVLWSQQVIADGTASAIVLNAGGANCFTGAFGFQTTHLTAEAVASALDVSAGDVLVCSTGLIGVGDETFRAGVLRGVDAAASALSPDGGADAARAIITTDTHSKQALATGEGWTIGGMAKGAGMLAPGLATMLVVLTTDAVLSSRDLDAALRVGDADHLRPTRLRRLHVHQRHGRAARERCVGDHAPPRRLRGRARGRVPRSRPAAADATPRARATTSPSR